LMVECWFLVGEFVHGEERTEANAKFNKAVSRYHQDVLRDPKTQLDDLTLDRLVGLR
jgi:hypothetical protein